ncbi:3-oxoacyl-[acyl-carrier-protein] synthase-3 [Kytococcus aerolatus]|uniref:3-oxoacyl-[acyl-carrier-protein] synthase-3 n=1 Tax=Kytococcus aerolatus TaxID=592308 RepID=A0A212U7U6_9MICO|nr:3-oxoacyl-ACP synthase III [Kytococcus aerolatus]SNC74332.1 3-oxoacyl-[acyl-carrier-protein] synthase-3 [Kytococcus aerolatus]
MPGNATFRHTNTSVLSVTALQAPEVHTSAEFDERIMTSLRRNRLVPGVLTRLVGIKERRWWPEDVHFTEAAAEAGRRALHDAGVRPEQIGLMVNTSVSRDHLEPSTAVKVHDLLGLPRSAMNFDVTNACLGFVNGMQIAAAMIDSGQIDYALIVNAETTRDTHERTLARLSEEPTTAEDILQQLATLTLGSGAAAMVLGRTDQHPEGHRFVGGVSRAATEHNELCVGDFDRMTTDSVALQEAGIALSEALWEEASEEFDWQDLDRYVIHQVSTVHTEQVCDRLGLDGTKVPRTFPQFGNMGPAAVPFTLALEAPTLERGDRVLLMGIGSGLNACCAEIEW